MIRLEKYCSRSTHLRTDGVKTASPLSSPFSGALQTACPSALNPAQGDSWVLPGKWADRGRQSGQRQAKAGRAAGGLDPGGHNPTMAQEANLSSSREGGGWPWGFSLLLAVEELRGFWRGCLLTALCSCVRWEWVLVQQGPRYLKLPG